MKKQWVVIAVLLGGLFPATRSRAQQINGISGSYVGEEILIKFNPTLIAADRDRILATHGASRIRRFAAVNIDHVHIPATLSVASALAIFRSIPGVLSADPNYVRQIVTNPPPNDPFWIDGTLWNMQQIHAQEAWGVSTGSAVVIADIDTGVNYSHEDLAANMWRNPLEIPGNGIDDDGNGYIDDVYGIDTINHDSDPMDDNGHGTHTAGTVAAVGNNGIGVVGVNWNAKILACKFMSSSGSGTDVGAIECFNYIVGLKNRGENIRVSNNSWGSGSSSATLQSAIDAAGNAGIVNVFAAGNNSSNDDTTPFYPASYTSSSIIAVAGSDQNDNPAAWTNVGATSVDIAAPGVSITSTYASGYATMSGTSMATPHVAGAAALLAAVNPSLSVVSIKTLLLNNVDRLPQWSNLVAAGGRLNVFRAASATTAANGAKIDVALASNGGTARSSSSYSSSYPEASTINGDRRGLNLGNGGVWEDGSWNTFPDWLEVDFDGSKTINEIDVFSVQDNSTSPVEPTPSMTFSLYGLRDFEVQYWTGAAWADVPGGVVSNNNLVWRQFAVGSLATAKIRIYITNSAYGHSRLAEVEAWSTPASRTNIALAGNGATAVASSMYNAGTYPTSATIDGDRRGMNLGNGGVWEDGSWNAYPDWLEVDFNGPKTVDEIDVFSVQDNYTSPVDPSSSMTFTLYGLRNFEVQYWTGTAWQDVPNGAVTNNNLVWRQFPVGSIVTAKIRVYVTNSAYGHSRLAEVEAWGSS